MEWVKTYVQDCITSGNEFDKASGDVVVPVRELVRQLNDAISELPAKVTALAVTALLNEIDANPGIMLYRIRDYLNDIDRRLKDELSLTNLFLLEEEKQPYYEPSKPLYGAEVQGKFPSASFEIDEAAKCLALERPTASVFHVMRTLEIALEAIRHSLRLQDPIKPADRNWGIILQNIKNELQRRNTASPVDWQNASDNDFFPDVYVSLDAVRNAWRNPTMHVERVYTSEDAEHIFIAVRGFMKKLASRMDEDGQPLA